MVNKISSEWQRIAALEIRLKGKVTLDDIQNIQVDIEEIDWKTTGKTQDLATKLLGQVEKKKKSVLNDQADATVQVFDLAQKIVDLDIRWNTLSPNQIAEELLSLNLKASTLPEKAPSWVQQVKKAAEEQLQHLHFTFAHPSIKELSRETLEPTFATRLHAIAERMRQENSLQPFKDLEPAQQREILATLQRRDA
jgi:hypothetical protein